MKLGVQRDLQIGRNHPRIVPENIVQIPSMNHSPRWERRWVLWWVVIRRWRVPCFVGCGAGGEGGRGMVSMACGEDCCWCWEKEELSLVSLGLSSTISLLLLPPVVSLSTTFSASVSRSKSSTTPFKTPFHILCCSTTSPPTIHPTHAVTTAINVPNVPSASKIGLFGSLSFVNSHVSNTDWAVHSAGVSWPREGA